MSQTNIFKSLLLIGLTFVVGQAALGLSHEEKIAVIENKLCSVEPLELDQFIELVSASFELLDDTNLNKEQRNKFAERLGTTVNTALQRLLRQNIEILTDDFRNFIQRIQIAFYININQLIEGHTLLHIATVRGKKVAVRILVELGASITLPNSDGKSALQLADANKLEEILDVFVEIANTPQKDLGEIPQPLIALLGKSLFAEGDSSVLQQILWNLELFKKYGVNFLEPIDTNGESLIDSSITEGRNNLMYRLFVQEVTLVELWHTLDNGAYRGNVKTVYSIFDELRNRGYVGDSIEQFTNSAFTLAARGNQPEVMRAILNLGVAVSDDTIRNAFKAAIEYCYAQVLVVLLPFVQIWFPRELSKLGDIFMKLKEQEEGHLIILLLFEQIDWTKFTFSIRFQEINELGITVPWITSHAIKLNRSKIIQHLITVDELDYHHALKRAVKCNKLDLLKILVEKFKYPNISLQESLCIANQKGHDEVARYLASVCHRRTVRVINANTRRVDERQQQVLELSIERNRRPLIQARNILTAIFACCLYIAGQT